MLFNAVKRRRVRLAPGRPGPGPSAPGVEPLEDRLVLSTYWWIGSLPNPVTRVANLNWSAPANWATDARPGSLPIAGDAVIFSTTDPHNPRRVINPNSTLDAAFRGGTISSLRIDPGYAGALTLAKNLTVTDSFTQAGGTVAGGATLTLQHTVLWYGGTMSGAGTTLIDGTEALGFGANSQIGAQPVTLDRRQLVIDQSAGVMFGGLNGAANVTLKNGAAIVNRGNCVLTSAPAGGLATITALNGLGTFWNSGTVQVGLPAARPTQGPDQGVIPAALAPLVAFRLNVRFNDLGGVVVEPNAWLWLSGGGSSDGAFTTVASSRDQVGNVLFTGQGATASTWDRATFQGPGTVFLAGSASVAGRTVAQNFTFVAGQLGLGSMAVGGSFRWLSGTMTGSGIFVLNQGATGQIGFAGGNPALTLLAPALAAALTGAFSGAAPALAQAAVFSNAGTIALQGAGLLLNGNALSRFDNGGTFTIQDSSGIGGGTSAVFNNLPGAVFQRANPGLPPSTVAVAFANAGNKAPGGGIIFKSLKQGDAAAQLSLNGETVTGLTPLVIQAGTVLGSGTLAGGVANAGAILPGVAGQPGILAVNGGLDEQAGGLIGIDINGCVAGVGYDQVSATGFVHLGGTLNVALNSYAPQLGDTFQILAFPGGYSGTFAAVNVPSAFGPPALPAGPFSWPSGFGPGWCQFQVVYDRNGVSLAVVSASGSAPVVNGIGGTSGGTAGGASVTITGSGFTDATAVTFGGTPALSYVVVDSSHIVAVAPPHAAGTCDVRVTNPVGTSPAGSADRFTYGTTAPGVPGTPPGLAAQGTTIEATAGTPFAGIVAWFVGSVPGGTAGSYTATINWGNGTTTAAAVRATSANTFFVVVGNTYAAAGTYTVSITITDSGRHSTTVTTAFTVAAAYGSLPTDPFAAA